jgi:predicted nucleic acid-binding protein
MTVAIDTNVLLDIQLRDAQYFARSADAVEHAAGESALIVGEIVYAELAVRMPADILEAFLADLSISYRPSPVEALRRAGEVYRAYVEARGAEVQCPHCGERFGVACPACKGSVTWRQHLIPDFLVGAHAETLAGSLLTRDRGVYRRFFPGLARYD